MTSLFVRPCDDKVTTDLSCWAQSFINMTPASSITEISGSSVKRSTVDAAIACHRHLFWFGHGQPDSLRAFGVAVVDSRNLSKLNQGIVVAIACYSAIGLGHNAHPSASCRAYLGFDDEFTIPTKGTLPMQLALVRGLECLFRAGHDIGCASSQLRAQFHQLREDYKQNGALYGLTKGEARLAWMCAKNNQFSLQLIGDSSATL